MELEQGLGISQQCWIDIDAMDHEDPMACTEYIHDIVRHLLEAEVGSAILKCFSCCVSTNSCVTELLAAEKAATLSELHGKRPAGCEHQHAWDLGGLAG